MEKRYVVKITPQNGVRPFGISSEEVELNELQTLVEGYIETIPTILGALKRHDIVMIANDESKIRQMPFNHIASCIATLAGDCICGVAVLAKKEEDKLVGFTAKEYECITRLIGAIL